MKTVTVDDRLYGALAEAATRNGRPLHDVLSEAIESWLADTALDDAERPAIERSRAEAAEQGGVDFEAFFDGRDPGV